MILRRISENKISLLEFIIILSIFLLLLSLALPLIIPDQVKQWEADLLETLGVSDVLVRSILGTIVFILFSWKVANDRLGRESRESRKKKKDKKDIDKLLD